MKNFTLLIAIFIIYNTSFAYKPVDFSVCLNLKSDSTNRKIYLDWSTSNVTKNFTLKRLEYINNHPNWIILKENTNDHSYIDSNLSYDRIYEYRVENHFDTAFVGYGYNTTVLNAIYQNSTKNLLLLVDEEVYKEIPQEINNYKKILICDNYRVYLRTAPRAEIFDSAKVILTKKIINDLRDTIDLDYILLFGRIPVAYSGALTIDGHSDHFGAFPADVYYTLSDRFFTDSLVESTSASLDRNKNVPFDGKFDLTNIEEIVKIAIGRVDFYDLPLFQESEIELYKNYITKIENYKYQKFPIEYKSIINDELGLGTYNEVWGAEGYINSYCLFGENNISEAPFKNNIYDNNYFISFSSAYSSYQHNGNIIGAQEFAENNINCIMSCIFGSYLGDWDFQNALLRSAIASTPKMLNSYFGGRPFWHLYSLNLGGTIGEAYKISINNDIKYKTTQLFGSRMVHIALMGDPTIRMYNIKPVINFNVEKINDIKTFTWENQNEFYVNIYSAKNIDSEFVKLNYFPIMEDHFSILDTCKDCIYMIRNVPKNNIQTRSARFYRESIGVLNEKIVNIKDNLTNNPEIEIKIFDNKIEINSNEAIRSYEIFNILGEKLLFNNFDNYTDNFIIDKSLLMNGIYICRINKNKDYKLLIY